jgi:hypothetical protein
VNRIRWPLQFDVEVEGHTVLAPKALVRIRYAGGQWSRTIRALVDTGSPMTIVSPQLAAKLGWVQPPGEAPLHLGGLGGEGAHPGWRAEMDVAFVQGPAQKSTEGLLLQGLRPWTKARTISNKPQDDSMKSVTWVAPWSNGVVFPDERGFFH